MVMMTFGPLPAVNPTTSQLVAGAVGQIYDVADTGLSSPLPVFDSTMVPIASLVATAQGLIPQFQVEVPAGYSVLWGSPGVPTLELVSWDGIAKAADAATTLAESLIPLGGATGQALVKASGADHDVAWITITGGSGPGSSIVGWADITGKPVTFPPDPHNHTAGQITDATSVGRAVLTAVDQQAARAAIGAGTGNGTSTLTLGTTATTAAAGSHAHSASSVVFAATALVPATNVQSAIELAASTGGGGGAGAIMPWRYAAGGYPAMPATAPAGVQLVIASGPIQPPTLPSWISDGTVGLIVCTSLAA